MAPESQANRLPFEPGGARKKAEKAANVSENKLLKRDKTTASTKRSGKRKDEKRKDDSSIPPAVSRRMIRRVAFLSGIPTFLGVVVFFVSYYLLIQNIIELPTVAVFLSTLGCFGLGVLGISYGVLSASWDEDEPGSILGWSEFALNLGRLRSVRRATRESKSKS